MHTLCNEAMTTNIASSTVLRQLIDERGIRYAFLADKIGVTRSHFTRLVNRERQITSAAAEALAGILGVETAAFFDGHDLRVCIEDAVQQEDPEASS